jgi:hypothetical protein
VQAATLGIRSTNDHHIDGERMKISERFVKGSWRYELRGMLLITHVTHRFGLALT